ncbi:MAG: 1-(5-phosphoribosyl)-5-[(5-phosphoribosylamino)methylideneamino]imidazole-4-carboxamide isomerase [Firmicutes bacterium HGW-Firmicutes-20]|jgi:phosphoribosylformimino-5-aminoimidazole carboxamide ribotide isomerase|nr:MAG: 1-(5-phosphoribosyl)-5-[(5-phosphoribosylamino)methylideneamino]imidazole-4-carboxamide isomerase [Firmicutes bacterium HGW-Firmicutes-20]PKM89854.1 MAG: 1-(5-phosphoribosyl)-5-[(5-phosphoribosylamino)methylideneamino]imidazole-4-carboxamide isomerase [Firmicutes bacterium HGW-Firmicutes-10]
MIVFPAIDIRDGQCVRLIQGRADQQTVYYQDPVEVAKLWEKQGAKYLHVIDLNGAFGQSNLNRAVITEIVRTLNIPIQVGGGVRSLEDAKALLDCGVNRVILGTAAIKNPSLLEELLVLYKEKIVVSLDCLDGFIQVEGWVDGSTVDAFEFAQTLKHKGVKTIVYTDISKDGMLQGPNFEQLSQIQKSGLDVIASGGVSSIDDALKIKEMGIYGAIVGKALYEKKIDLKELLEVVC